MRKIFFLLLGIYFSSVKGLAQDKAYFGQTEIGFLLGRGQEDWEGNHPDRIDISFQTFHGARISPHHVLGFSVGLDQYQSLSVVPIAMGYRGFLGKAGKPQIFGGLDLGGGSMFLEEKSEWDWGKSWYEGGILISPMAGFKLPSKKGKTALSFTFAYKRQELSYIQANYDQGRVQPLPNSSLPPGYNSLTETAYLFNSFVFRMGLMF